MVKKQTSRMSSKPSSVKTDKRQPILQSANTLIRGEVWLVALDPTLGSEIQKTRPCLIISPPEIHNYLRTALAAPMTAGGTSAPFRIPVHFKGKNGLILLDQIRALDKQRLVRRLGMIDAPTIKLTLARLQDIFAE
jgi:mRNA interferase MazF